MSVTTAEWSSIGPLCAIALLNWAYYIYTFRGKMQITRVQRRAIGLYVLWLPLQWMNLLATRRALVGIALTSSMIKTTVSWWATVTILNDSFEPRLYQWKAYLLWLASAFLWDGAGILVFAPGILER